MASPSTAERPSPPGRTTFECRECGPLSSDRFFPAVRNAGKRGLCIDCSSEQRAKNRKLHPRPLVEATCGLRKREGLPNFTLEEFVSVLDEFGHRCPVTGAEKGLTLVRVDPRTELSVENALPLRATLAEHWAFELPAFVDADALVAEAKSAAQRRARPPGTPPASPPQASALL